VGDFSRRRAVSDTQAMICALKFNKILIGLPGIVVAPWKTSGEKFFIEQTVVKPATDLCWRLRARNVDDLPNRRR
jgi:hypothetical protein